MFLAVPHLCYQIFQLPYGNHTKPSCGLFLKNYRYLREMFLRHLRDVTEKTPFSRYVWDVLKMSYRHHKKDIFFKKYLRRLKDISKKSSLLRCFWEVSEMSFSMEIWLRSLRDISCRLGQESQGVLVKMVFLTLSQYPQENVYVGVFYLKSSKLLADLKEILSNTVVFLWIV